MLQRYCELVEELSVLEKSLVADLSIEEIMRYLDLRREQEELAGELGYLITEALLHLQDLANRVEEELVDLPGIMESAKGQVGFREGFLTRLAGVIGALEADMERILADCRQLRYELLWGENREINSEAGLPVEQMHDKFSAGCGEDKQGSEKMREVGQKQEKVLEEVACALELAEAREESSSGRSGQNNRGHTDGKASSENDKSAPISPETLKKLETVMRPKEALEIEPVLMESQASFAVLKVASSGEGKSRHGKTHKERHRR
ncbi:hypothetical protein [Desulfofundulus salinus]|uniref:Uncharacterized protein n=1 Tax=Desulfofundulus salinus TaxID=2419843 RepID=A0A494WVH0_9FIRM|nr:hypothetical protein [Desulfofundulus salinum]RKO67478.1 hypothetical protein D7024_11220 [Desulfofundulus salinum]